MKLFFFSTNYNIASFPLLAQAFGFFGFQILFATQKCGAHSSKQYKGVNDQLRAEMD